MENQRVKNHHPNRGFHYNADFKTEVLLTHGWDLEFRQENKIQRVRIWKNKILGTKWLTSKEAWKLYELNEKENEKIYIYGNKVYPVAREFQDMIERNKLASDAITHLYKKLKLL